MPASPEIFETIRLGNLENPKKLIVLLHGIATDNETFRRVGESFAAAIPDAAVLIPRAPRKIGAEHLRPAEREIIYNGGDLDLSRAYSWFDTHPVRLSIKMLFNKVDAVTDLNRYLDNRLKEFGLENKDLGLFGFSQGGALALYTALERQEKCGAVISHSGPYLGMRPVHSRPDTYMIVGANDPINKPAPLFSIKRLFNFSNSIKRLRRRNIPVKSSVCKELGHRANEESITKSIDFIRHRLQP